MIKETLFKGYQAILMENKKIRVVILPKLGGKLVSFYLKEKDFELLFQNKESTYRQPNLKSNFVDFDASGFDDCFPTINPSIAKYNGKEVYYPDHGEIWTASFNLLEISEDISLSYRSKILPYLYFKRISIENNYLHLHYSIENQGNEAFECIWAMHCLINCHQDIKLIFPAGITRIINVLDSKYLGEKGTIHTFPVTIDQYGQEYRLDRISPPEMNKCEKYYALDEIKNGVCGVYYPIEDVLFQIHYNSSVLPYLGFWVTEGGFRGDYNCAFEPTNSFYDSLDIARKEKKLFKLMPGHPLEFSISMSLE